MPRGTITTREHSYLYDTESNLTREQVTRTIAPNETRTQAYDLDGALCWTAPGDHTGAGCGTAPAGATGYSYSADGSLTTTGDGLGATYSLRGHMVEIAPPGGAAIAMARAPAERALSRRSTGRPSPMANSGSNGSPSTAKPGLGRSSSRSHATDEDALTATISSTVDGSHALVARRAAGVIASSLAGEGRRPAASSTDKRVMKTSSDRAADTALPYTW